MGAVFNLIAVFTAPSGPRTGGAAEQRASPHFDTLVPAPYSRRMPIPPGFVPACLPTKAPQPPTGEAWLHEKDSIIRSP